MSKILDGKKVREFLAEKIKKELNRLRIVPRLVIIQVGADERSSAYIKQKKTFGERLGFTVEHVRLSKRITEKHLLAEIGSYNKNKHAHGIIVQLPLPKHIDPIHVVEAIDPQKDVDGLNSRNVRFLVENISGGLVPATTKGILALLDFYKITVEGKKVVVVGHSLLVGRPTALAFLNRDATVTICHKKTKNLKQETRAADIIVIATGKPGLITKSFVKPGQVIVDVGITKIGENFVGDVDFKAVSKIVKAITPVPGGVGPMTVVSLFENVLVSYKRQNGLE